jgi:hypothetical protein
VTPREGSQPSLVMYGSARGPYTPSACDRRGADEPPEGMPPRPARRRTAGPTRSPTSSPSSSEAAENRAQPCPHRLETTRRPIRDQSWRAKVVNPPSKVR